MSKKTITDIHNMIMESCYRENSFLYNKYGAKGIKVCEEWHDRDKFKAWCVDNGWQTGMTIRRVDSDKDYCPENCYIDEMQSKKVHELTKSELAYSVLGTKLTNHPLANIYAGMKARCYKEDAPNYIYYGARGIKISNDWLGKYGIVKFIIWSLENGWEDGLTIDRIDNYRGYAPDNCRWIPPEEQAKNRRNVVLYEYQGKLVSINEACRMSGVPHKELSDKIKAGMNIEAAIKQLQEEKATRQALKAEKQQKKNDEENIKENLKSKGYFSNGNINYAAVEKIYGVSRRDVRALVKGGIELSEAIARLKPKA